MTIRSIPFSEAFTRMTYDLWKTRSDRDEQPEEEHDMTEDEFDNLLAERDAEIERLNAERDKWKHECQIAYKAFDESHVKKTYEAMHQADIEEHNRMMHELAVRDAKIERLKEKHAIHLLQSHKRIKELKTLLTRSADALTRYGVIMENNLIKELREATK